MGSAPSPTARDLKLGVIGLDTSHVEALAATFNDPASPHAIPGTRITTAFPGGSPDFPLSWDRLPRYTELFRDRYEVTLVESPRAVAEAVDAVLLTSVDGRVHLRQFSDFADLRRPTFIDKPFAVTNADARALAALARQRGAPLFSSSNLRFAAGLRTALADASGGAILGADFSGPMPLQPTQPGYFWYGIHTVEMLYAALGPGCVAVNVVASPGHDVIVGRWRDGRLGIARGHLTGSQRFCGTLHRERTEQWLDASTGTPAAHTLARAIHDFFRGAPAPVSLDETVELIAFLTAANESRARGGAEVELELA